MAERHTNPKWKIGMNSTRFQIGLILSLSFAYWAFQTTGKMPKTTIVIDESYTDNFITQIHDIQLKEPEPKQEKVIKKEETNPEHFEKIELIDNKIEKKIFDPITFSTPEFPLTPITFFNDKPHEFKPDSVFEFSEISPSFPGGPQALAQYLRKNIHFPEDALRAEVDGRVIVEFMVGASGKVSRIRVLKDEVGYRCSQSAVEAVEKMPNWTPGRVNDQPVNVWYRLPVYYTVK